ncbi:MAG: hypothetical protein N3B21_19445 [Clostridia bacterium]|nr:hypothetical protein [Clostridia bacterium]
MRIESLVKRRFDKEISEAKRIGINIAVRDLTAAFILSLYDEFGFGKERIYRLLRKVTNNLECINEGHLTLDDIRSWCEDKGIDYKLIIGEKTNYGK